MVKKRSPRLIIHFYSKVGAPELVFFICLLSLLFIPFIFQTDETVLDPILFTFFVFSIEYLVLDWKSKHKRSILFILFLAIIGAWLRHFDIIVTNYVLSLTEILVLAISFYFISKSIFASPKVDFNTLLAAVSGYILLGMALGVIVNICENAFPDYFGFTTDFTSYDSFYYSFVTMSTLGYGDISPTNRGGQGLAILITLLGQFYMVIVMGLIIGKLLAPNNSDT